MFTKLGSLYALTRPSSAPENAALYKIRQGAVAGSYVADLDLQFSDLLVI